MDEVVSGVRLVNRVLVVCRCRIPLVAYVEWLFLSHGNSIDGSSGKFSLHVSKESSSPIRVS